MGWPWDCPRYASLCGHSCFNSVFFGWVSGLWLLFVVAKKIIWNLWDFCSEISSRLHTWVPGTAYTPHHHAGGPPGAPTCSRARSQSPDEYIPYPSGLKPVSEENSLNPLGFKYTALCYHHENLTLGKTDTSMKCLFTLQTLVIVFTIILNFPLICINIADKRCLGCTMIVNFLILMETRTNGTTSVCPRSR